MSGRSLCGNAGGKHLQYAQRAMRKFIPVMKNDKLNLWRAVYAEKCKYGFGREYGTVEAGDRLCLPHDLDIQVSKLKLLKANHTSQKYHLEDSIVKRYPVQIASIKEQLAGYQVDIQTYKQSKFPDKDTFSMKIGDRVYMDKKEAGMALIEMCRSAKQPRVGVIIGEYQGFQMSVCFDSFFSKYIVNLKGQISHEVEIGVDPFGNLQRLNNVLEAMDRKMEELGQKLENVEHQLEIAKIEVMRPFSQEEELAEKMERLAELNVLLNMDEKGNEGICIAEEMEDGDAEKGDIEKRSSEGIVEEVVSKSIIVQGELKKEKDVESEPKQIVADSLMGHISVKEKLAEMRGKVNEQKVIEKQVVQKIKEKEERM